MTEKVTIIIPAYNEALYLPKMLQSVLRLKSRFPRFQKMNPLVHYLIDDVIVVDDGSTDNTARIAVQNGATLVSLEKNCGKAFAVYAGFRRARENGSTIVVTLDADLKPVTKKQLDKLVLPVAKKECKMTVGLLTADLADLTGQRAIRMSALEPLFSGNRKWRIYFGIRNGRMVRRAGFGLEVALNELIGRIGPYFGTVSPHKNVRAVQTDFETQRKAYQKNIVGKPELDNMLEQNFDINRYSKVWNRRYDMARKRREFRASNKAQHARALHNRHNKQAVLR